MSTEFAGRLAATLSGEVRVLDVSMTETAFRSVAVEDPFNLTVGEARQIGAVVGCDHFFLVRAASQRRAMLDAPDSFESYAVIYGVSSRTGGLEIWKLVRETSDRPESADSKLMESADEAAADLAVRIKELARSGRQSEDRRQLEEVPEPGSPEAKNFKAPIPYRRIKPEYTRLAYLYNITASVEIEADIDAGGEILGTRIVRWAGFGLDEEVTAAVRKMNWRPAMRNSKPLPMRVLLRYNFRKFETDEPVGSR